MSLCAATKELELLRKEIIDLRNEIEDLKRKQDSYHPLGPGVMDIITPWVCHSELKPNQVYTITRSDASMDLTPEETWSLL